jgi:hypothetical protein
MVSRRNLLIGGAVIIAGAGAAGAEIWRMGTIEDYGASIAPLRMALPATPDARDLIRFATLAANSHNAQAWQFRLDGDSIGILPDLSRATPIVDPDNHHLFTSLGCAAENLSIAAASLGTPGEVRFDPASGEISFARTSGAVTDTALSDAIPVRQSTRGLFDGSTLNTADLGTLASTVRGSGVDLVLVTDPALMGQVADLIATANTAQIADPAFMAELKHWMRFSPRRAMATGDGLFSATRGNPAMPEWLGPRVLDWAYTAETENKQNTAKITSSAGLAIFVGADETAASWVQVGGACQRFALQATAMDLKHAYLNQPVEVASLRLDLATLIGMPGRRPDLVIRFGRGAALPYSARRPVAAVMT